jgi:hypothetical protein
MTREAAGSPGRDLSDAWGHATKRVWPTFVAAITIFAEGLTIYLALSILSLLDRSFLFVAAAFATLFLISVLASQELATKLGELRGRLSAVSHEKDKSDEIAKKVPELETRNADLTERLGKAGERVVGLEGQVRELTAKVSTMEREREVWATDRAKLEQRIAVLVRENSDRETRLQGLGTQLRDEQSNTARAGYIPSLEVDFGTTGFGVLGPKKVHADIKNLGPGIAKDVEFSAAPGKGPAVVPYTSLGYWTAVPKGEARRVILGDADSLSSYDWVRCRVTYGSQFGPCPPVEIVYTPA